jgi:hypothetical protein
MRRCRDGVAMLPGWLRRRCRDAGWLRRRWGDAAGVAQEMVSAPQLAISQVFVLMTVPEAVSAVMPTDIAETRAR